MRSTSAVRAGAAAADGVDKAYWSQSATISGGAGPAPEREGAGRSDQARVIGGDGGATTSMFHRPCVRRFVT